MFFLGDIRIIWSWRDDNRGLINPLFLLWWCSLGHTFLWRLGYYSDGTANGKRNEYSIYSALLLAINPIFSTIEWNIGCISLWQKQTNNPSYSSSKKTYVNCSLPGTSCCGLYQKWLNDAIKREPTFGTSFPVVFKLFGTRRCNILCTPSSRRQWWNSGPGRNITDIVKPFPSLRVVVMDLGVQAAAPFSFVVIAGLCRATLLYETAFHSWRGYVSFHCIVGETFSPMVQSGIFWIKGTIRIHQIDDLIIRRLRTHTYRHLSLISG